MRKKDRKNRMDFETLCFVLAVAVFAAVLCTPLSFAGKELDNMKDDLTDVQDQLDDAQKDLKEGKAKSAQLSAEIKTLEGQIYTTEVEINGLQSDINDTKQEITDKLEKLDRVQTEIDNQNSALNSRLRAMYKNGDAGMLSVLFGSATMSDLLTNIEMVKRIYNADAQLLLTIEDRYAEVDAEKEELLLLKKTLETQQAQLEEKQAGLAADQEEVKSKKSQIDSDNAVLAEQIDALNEEAEALTQKILVLQSQEAYIGGKMLWPSQASTRITSPFGNRLHPILKVYKMHTGIDIGAGSGTNILAANAGKVISAGWNNSYGYMIMVDHGGGIVTLYAHCSSLLVKKDDIVSRGQVIGLVGSTGRSTGPHLHFEVRVDGAYKNPLDYVSP